MRLPALPGPGDLSRLLDQLVSAVPRALTLLDAAELLLADTRALLERIEVTRVGAEEMVSRTEGTRLRAEAALDEFEEPSRRLIGLLDGLQPSLLRLQPTIERLADTTSVLEVDAAVSLIDRLPLLVTRLEQDVLPMLGTLNTVGPDLHQLLETSQQLNELLSNLPGMGRILKKIDDD